MNIPQNSFILCFSTFFTCMAFFSCQAKEDAATDLSVDARISDTSQGGLPTLNEVKDVLPTTDTEATTASQSLKSVITGSLSIDLGSGSSGSQALHLTEGGGGGGDGLFGIASAFGLIFNMVTGGARCNFDLLLNDENGEPLTLKKVDGYDVYVTPYGFGTVGLGDEGVLTCPDRETVYDWARANQLITGSAQTTHDDEDEFYIPSRLVIYKIDENKFKWQVVFFPEDMITELTTHIPQLSGLLSEDLDFIVYSGIHEATSEETGVGSVTLDFTELQRMATLLNSLGEPALRLEGEDSMPDGEILVEYDTTADPTSITTTFLSGFTFGEDDNSPFTTDSPTTIYKSGSEIYMHFITPMSMVGGDDEEQDSEDSGLPIQICPSEESDGLGTGANDVPTDQYLAAKNSHYQLIWTEAGEEDETPDNYLAEIVSDGGPFLYGEVVFQGGRKGGSTAGVLRIKAPTCDALNQSVLDMFETQFNAPLIDEDGFLNLSMTPGGSAPFLTKEEVLAGFPVFEHFKLVDINDETDLPFVE